MEENKRAFIIKNHTSNTKLIRNIVSRIKTVTCECLHEGVLRLAIPPYILEHGVVEFAGGMQGDPSVEEALDDGKCDHDNHHHAINELVEVQVFVLWDVALAISLIWWVGKKQRRYCE